jgi:hypothetical protein
MIIKFIRFIKAKTIFYSFVQTLYEELSNKNTEHGKILTQPNLDQPSHFFWIEYKKPLTCRIHHE